MDQVYKRFDDKKKKKKALTLSFLNIKWSRL